MFPSPAREVIMSVTISPPHLSVVDPFNICLKPRHFVTSNAFNQKAIKFYDVIYQYKILVLEQFSTAVVQNPLWNEILP